MAATFAVFRAALVRKISAGNNRRASIVATSNDGMSRMKRSRGRNFEVLHFGPAGDGETAKARGRSVVGVAFELGTELKQFVAAEICSRDFV